MNVTSAPTLSNNTATGLTWADKTTPVPTPTPLVHTCPHCGHCPYCGRGGYHTYPWPTIPSWPGFPPGWVPLQYTTY